jgi:hypothetical protein
MPNVFAGAPEPLRIVFTTVVGEGPAALLLVLSTAIADGSIAKEIARVIVRRERLPFMIHQSFCVGI